MLTEKEAVNERMSERKGGRTGGIKASVRKIRRAGEEGAGFTMPRASVRLYNGNGII